MLPISWSEPALDDLAMIIGYIAEPNYIVIYQVKTDCIEVLSVLHSRQEYP